MKYIFLILLISSLSLNFIFSIGNYNRGSGEIFIWPPKGSEAHKCTESINCAIRLDRLACILAERTEKGLIGWNRVDGIGGEGHYFGLGITNNSNVIVSKNYMWFNISIPPYDGQSIDKSVDNLCAIELYKYLTNKTENKTEFIKQEALKNFIDEAEKLYEIP